MTLRGRGDSLLTGLQRAAVSLILLVACANSELPRAGTEDRPPSPRGESPPPSDASEDPPPLAVCEYRNVFVAFDNFDPSADPRAEPLRRAILNRASGLLPQLGWVEVTDPSDAYWQLFADAWVGREGNPLVHLGMRGELKLGRHLFVVSMADESFPFRGGVGGSYNFANASVADAGQLDAQVEIGMRWIQALDSEQIAALCEVRNELIDEGWTAVEELRQALIEEMEQVRQARARSSLGKHLEIEVEEPQRLERAE
jgi:hypothetical protein